MNLEAVHTCISHVPSKKEKKRNYIPLMRTPRIRSTLDTTRHNWAISFPIGSALVYRPRSPIKNSKTAMITVILFGACGFIHSVGRALL